MTLLEKYKEKYPDGKLYELNGLPVDPLEIMPWACPSDYGLAEYNDLHCPCFFCKDCWNMEAPDVEMKGD